MKLHAIPNCKVSRAIPASAKVPALIAGLCGGVLLAGCTSMGGKTEHGAAVTSVPTQAEPFKAPYDSRMGQLILGVPEVLVSAPVIASAGRLVRTETPSTLSSIANFLVGDTADGITDADSHSSIMGSHEHFNSGFSTNGVHQITFQAPGQQIDAATNISSPDAKLTFLVLPLPAQSPFQLWQQKYWPDDTPDSVKGPNADPDGDGFVNTVEYALNLNPTVPSNDALPTASIVLDGGKQYGTLSFTRVKAATDLQYTVVAASGIDGAPWAPMTNVVSVIDYGVTESVAVRDDVQSSALSERFYRLQISLSP